MFVGAVVDVVVIVFIVVVMPVAFLLVVDTAARWQHRDLRRMLLLGAMFATTGG